MMIVHEVSKLSGVSIRALHHYDKIELLPATEVTESGYRMYDEAALMRLQQIMLFKESQLLIRKKRRICQTSKGLLRRESKAIEGPER